MITVERDVDAKPELLWAVVADPESWPRWTASMNAVEMLDDELAVGARARVHQPGLRTAVWTVTELVPGESFVWTMRSGGVTTVGSHTVQPLDGDRSRVVLGIEQRGLLASVIRMMFGATMRSFATMEADGLKAAAEAAARPERPAGT